MLACIDGHADMVAMLMRIQQAQALMEQTTFQMCKGIDERRLSAMMAMCKIEASQCMEFCAREASQIFGGRSYLRGGVAAMGVARGSASAA